MHHGAGLRQLLTLSGRSAVAADEFVAALTQDYRTADLEPPDRAMLDYALAITQAPHAVTGEAVAALRSGGFDDRGVHDICAITAYFAFVNRIADGLGVELEERFRMA